MEKYFIYCFIINGGSVTTGKLIEAVSFKFDLSSKSALLYISEFKKEICNINEIFYSGVDSDYNYNQSFLKHYKQWLLD